MVVIAVIAGIAVQTPTASVRFNTSPLVLEKGETKDVQVLVSSNSTKIAGVQFKIIAGNPDIATISAISSIPDINYYFSDSCVSDSDTYCVLVSLGNNSLSKMTLNISVTAVENGTATISLKDLKVADAEGNKLSVDCSNCSLDVIVTPNYDVVPDFVVNSVDLQQVRKYYGMKVDNNNRADINNDSIVNYVDLVILRSHYNETIPHIAT